MWSYSLPARGHSTTISSVGLHLVQGKTQYAFSFLIAILMLTSLTLYMLFYGYTQPAANVAAEGVESESVLPIEAPVVSTDEVKTELQATVVTDSPKENTELRINNQSVPVPDNNTIHETVHGNGTTSLNVSVNSVTDGSSSNESSTSIQLNTKSDTETEFEFSQ